MVDRYGQSPNGVVDRWMWMQMGLVGVRTGDRQEMGSRPRQMEGSTDVYLAARQVRVEGWVGWQTNRQTDRCADEGTEPQQMGGQSPDGVGGWMGRVPGLDGIVGGQISRQMGENPVEIDGASMREGWRCGQLIV